MSSTLEPRKRARTVGAAVGLVFGGLAIAVTMLFGGIEDWSRDLGWLVLVLAPPIGAALGPMAAERGHAPALLAALLATVVAVPAGALLYTLALGITTGQTDGELLIGALAAAVFGLVVAGIPLGLMTFVAASLAVLIVRAVIVGPSSLAASYAGSARSRANR